MTVALQRSKIHELLLAGLHSDLLAAKDHGDIWSMPPLTPAQRVLAAGLFERNLVWMAQQVHDFGGEVLMVTPISDMTLKPRAGATEAETKDLGRTEGFDAASLDAALAARPDDPLLLWMRGRGRWEAGDPRGCDDLHRASDLDPRPLHASEAMADAMRAAATQSDARLLDLRARVLEEHCLPPPDWFIDEVHLSEEGHRQVAALLAPAVAEALGGP